MEKQLNELVERLKRAEGENLQAVVLYGSAASDEYRPKHSDLNVLCLLRQLNPAALGKLHAAFKWWTKKGYPAALVFTLEELERAADVYAMEMLDIRASHRVLYGEDVFSNFDVPLKLHRGQVERELRHNLIRLRQGYIAAAEDPKALRALMVQSASTFAVLCRHVLIALGEQAPASKREAVGRLAATLGFDPAPFETLFEVRSGREKEKSLDAPALFKSYFEAITRAVNEVDRRFAELAGA
ncbi:MAG TPA: nucleotidyltransferase domain-containing protein [Terriglobia bacterium]|nr:nucleotidyltransferase domain-containing protein [Terriglobia bacterium]